jgi:ubiquinone/menaquinone biosynthesis C-methylase UbiE
MNRRRTPDMFDRWALTYDEMLEFSKDSFPFAGYDGVLDRIVELSSPRDGMRILDMGIGTGELAKRFLNYNCEVWGFDFSERMLELAGKKIPSAHLIKGDIGSKWPEELSPKFDRVVSAYTLHHFNLDEKLQIIRRILNELLLPKGILVIGDVSFSDFTELGKTRTKLIDEWDDNEFYWAADTIKMMTHGTDIYVTYEQVSFCGGIYVVISSEHL